MDGATCKPYSTQQMNLRKHNGDGEASPKMSSIIWVKYPKSILHKKGHLKQKTSIYISLQYVPSFYWNYLLRGFIVDSLISLCSPRNQTYKVRWTDHRVFWTWCSLSLGE